MSIVCALFGFLHAFLFIAMVANGDHGGPHGTFAGMFLLLSILFGERRQ